MPPTDDVSSENMQDRIVELESLVTHLQHELELLNSVMIEQHDVIDALRRDQQRLEGQFERLQGEELRDPQSEKPPHY